MSTESQWPERGDPNPRTADGDGLDSAILRATVGARLFDTAPFRIGRFTVIGRLGAGGMGVVYLGYDPELAREVAIKVLRAEDSTDPLRSERSRARMRSEAQAMAKLRHANVVTVHEVGEHDGGLFVAMEYVRGTTLRGWATAESRSVAQIVSTWEAAGRGLAAAHDAGLVHRDFKPDNVLVGEDGRVLVTDFGLATQVSESVPTEPDGETLGPERSRSGIAGTPAYMAPECLQGEPATAQSDQFSYCVGLYEALWGGRPFGESLAALAVLLRGTDPPRPPGSPRVLKAVRDAVLRGLSRDPEARFGDMDQLLRALTRDRGATARRGFVVGVLGLAGGAAWWSARAPAPCSDLDAPIGAVWNDARKREAAQAFATSGLPYASAAWTTVAAGVDAWSTAWIDEANAACRATEIQHTQSEVMLDRRVTCLDARRRELVALLEVFDRADADAIERGPSAVERLPSPTTCADLEALDRRAPIPEDREAYDALVDRVAAARAEYTTGHYDRARVLAEPTVAAAVALGHRPTEADARLVLGDALDELGQADASSRELDASIAAAEAGGADEISARAWIDLAYVEAWSRSDVPAAERALGFAAAEIEALGDPHELHGTLTKVRAAVVGMRGDYVQAEALGRAAVDELVLARAGQIRIGAAKLGVGGNLYDAGKWPEALEWMRDAQRDFTDALGPSHPSTLSARSNAANVLSHLRRLDESMAEHREVLALREASLGPDHPTIGANLGALANAHYYRGEHAEAVAYQRRALALVERTRSRDHRDALILRENLAAFLSEAGEPQAALDEAESLLADRRRVQSADHPDVVTALETVAGALAQLGRHDEAAARYAEALELAGRVLAPDHPLMLDLHVGAGRAALARGRLDDALTSGQRALAVAEKEYGPGHVKLRNSLELLEEIATAQGRAADAAGLRARIEGIAAAQ